MTRPAPTATLVATLLSFALVASPRDVLSAAPRDVDPGRALIRVVDATDGQAVPYANLVFLDSSDGWLADGDGVFELLALPPGLLRFRVVHVSYEPAEIEVRIVAGESVSRVVALTPHAHELDVVEVHGAREIRQEHAARGQRIVTKQESEPLPNPGDDVFRMIRILPGVTSDDVGGEFHLRGGGVDETLVRIDGLTVRQLFHGRDFGGITGIVPLDAVTRTEVYAGGFPAEYGGRLSGVVDVGLRDDGARGWHGKIAGDVISMRAFVERNSETGSLFASAREGYLDRVLGAVQDQATIEPAYRDLLLRAVHRPRPGHSLSINYLRSEDHILYEDAVGAHRVDADYIDHYFWLSGRAVGSRIALEGTAWRSRSSQLRLTSVDDRDDHRLDQMGARVAATVPLPRRHTVTVGVEHDREDGYVDVSNREVVRIDTAGETEFLLDFEDREEIDAAHTSLFVQDEWVPRSGLTLNAGVRANHYARISAIDGTRLNPRLSAAWSPNDVWTAKGAWGFYEQLPQTGLEGDDVTLRVRGDRPERAEHYLLGLERRFASFTAGVDAYEKRFHEMTGVIARTVDGQLTVEAIDRGVARGVDLYANGRRGSTAWWASYTLARSVWGSESLYARSFDRRHSLSLAGTHTIGSAWDVGVSYTFHSGLPYTRKEWTRDQESRDWVLDEGVPYADRLPAYHRIDVRVRRHFRFSGWAMAVYVEALNLTNHDNVLWYAWGFRTHDGTKVPVRSTRTGMPGVPSLGVEVRF